jgi:cache domain-containing protein
MFYKPSLTLIIRGFTVLAVIGFIYVLGISFQFIDKNRELVREGIQQAQQIGENAQSQIESNLRRIAETVDEASKNLLKNGQNDSHQLLATLRNTIYSDPGFVEAGVAFAPFSYDPHIRLYGVSYVVDENGMRLHDLDSREDYTKPEAVWYHRAMEGETVWLEPEYNDARHEMLVTYAAPLFNMEKNSKPVGVVFATYSVSSLERIFDHMDLGDNGYSFLLSSEKHFIVHHNQDYIDHRWSLDDFLARLTNTFIKKTVSNALLNSSQIVRLTDPDTNQDSQIFFLPIPEAEWTLGILLYDEDLQMPSSIARIKLLHIVLALCVSVFLLTIPLSGIQYGSIRSFWILSNVFTICCVISYVTALKLTTDQPPDNFIDSQLITNQNTLNNFMSDQRRRTLEQREEIPLFIPTGLHIQAISFDSSIEGIAINGQLWQRYTLGIHDDIDREILIVGSDSFELEAPITTRFGNTELVRWNFKASLYQEFDFSKYPFGREYMQTQLRHKQFTRNIILVPDLESYKLINPTALPGLQDDIFLRGWNIKKSFFNYRFENYNTNFGLTDYAGLTDFPELYFTIEISKQVFGAVISHALPLVVVALLLFALLLLSTNMESGKLEVVEAIAACAGFFLVIVFSHLGIRESFAVQDIMYLEYFYYVTYVLILFTVANYVMIASQKEDELHPATSTTSKAPSQLKFIRHHDNLFVKIVYWPASQLAVLILTLLEFY